MGSTLMLVAVKREKLAFSPLCAGIPSILLFTHHSRHFLITPRGHPFHACPTVAVRTACAEAHPYIFRHTLYAPAALIPPERGAIETPPQAVPHRTNSSTLIYDTRALRTVVFCDGHNTRGRAAIAAAHSFTLCLLPERPQEAWRCKCDKTHGGTPSV